MAALPEVSMIHIANTADLRQAQTQPRAFIFLWVAWAIQARQSEEVFQGFLESWQDDHPDLPVPAYRADLSSQCGEVWEEIRSWLQSEGQSTDQLIFGGCGALLWLLSGRVEFAAVNVATIERLEFITHTEKVFVRAT